MSSSRNQGSPGSTLLLLVLILLWSCILTEGFWGGKVIRDDRVNGLSPEAAGYFHDIDVVMKDVYNTGQMSYDQGKDVLKNFEYIVKKSSPNQSVQVSNLLKSDLEKGNPRGSVADYIDKFFQNITKMDKSSDMIQEAEKTKSLIQTDEDKNIPKKPSFFQRLFGTKSVTQAYPDLTPKLQGMFSTTDKIVKEMDESVKSNLTALFNGNNSNAGEKTEAAGNVIKGAGALINNIFGDKNNSNTTTSKVAQGFDTVGDLVSSIAGSTSKNKTSDQKAQDIGGAVSKLGDLVTGFSNSTNSTTGKFGQAISGVGQIVSAAAGNQSNTTGGKVKAVGDTIANIVSGFETNNKSHVGQTISEVVNKAAPFVDVLAKLFGKKTKEDNSNEKGKTDSQTETTTESGLESFAKALGGLFG